MKKTGVILLAVLLACVICAFLAMRLMLPNDRPGVNKSNMDRIELNMTKSEVEAIFGNKGERIFVSNEPPMPMPGPGAVMAKIPAVEVAKKEDGPLMSWEDPQTAFILIRFDKNDRVAEISRGVRERQSVMQRFRQWWSR
jgi:hypothetical protein